jgi:hypothetical protein
MAKAGPDVMGVASSEISPIMAISGDIGPLLTIVGSTTQCTIRTDAIELHVFFK